MLGVIDGSGKGKVLPERETLRAHRVVSVSFVSWRGEAQRVSPMCESARAFPAWVSRPHFTISAGPGYSEIFDRAKISRWRAAHDEEYLAIIC